MLEELIDTPRDRRRRNLEQHSCSDTAEVPADTVHLVYGPESVLHAGYSSVLTCVQLLTLHDDTTFLSIQQRPSNVKRRRHTGRKTASDTASNEMGLPIVLLIGSHEKVFGRLVCEEVKSLKGKVHKQRR